MKQLIKFTKTLIIVFLPFLSLSQTRHTYYVNFNTTDSTYIQSGTYGNYILRSNSSVLTEIYSRHTIIDFQKSFPTTQTLSLQNTYTLESDSTLFVELKNNNPSREMYRITDAQTLAENSSISILPITPLPNDYSLAYPQYNLDLINSSEAWQYTTGNPNLRLGITDSPFDIGNPELSGKIFRLPNSSPNQFPNIAGPSHGTICAALMAGRTNNGIGLAPP